LECAYFLEHRSFVLVLQINPMPFKKLSTLPDLNKQLVKFTMIGVLAVLVDLACYYLLLNLFPEKMLGFASNESVAKTISFLCGMSVTYSLNKLWTWKQVPELEWPNLEPSMVFRW
jgi:putative flippase GtrA